MKGGMVVRMRISPRDCMSILDAAEAAGMKADEFSFSALSSIVMSSILEGLRRSNTIPHRDGFEYLRMMEPFLNKKGAARQNMTAALYGKPVLPISPPSTVPAREEKTHEELVAEFTDLHNRWDDLTDLERDRYNSLNGLLFQ